MIKRLFFSSLVAIGVLSAGSGYAAVTYGPVDQYYTNSTTTYVYVTPPSFTGVPAYQYYCSTTDPELARAIVSSLHNNVYLSCSATSWSTSGTLRNGGAVNWIYVN